MSEELRKKLGLSPKEYEYAQVSNNLSSSISKILVTKEDWLSDTINTMNIRFNKEQVQNFLNNKSYNQDIVNFRIEELWNQDPEIFRLISKQRILLQEFSNHINTQIESSSEKIEWLSVNVNTWINNSMSLVIEQIKINLDTRKSL